MKSQDIIVLAHNAAESAFDCFGHESELEIPSALMAYSFMYQKALDEPEAVLPQLTRQEFKLFAAQYNLQIAQRRLF